ncbi:hypothetical protein PAXRUDRAFT_122477, partial [Paxillus rubicundulus Ve08.2h10]
MAEALGLNKSGTNEAREQALKERFPIKKDEELVCKLTLLLDWAGVIMTWHLSGVLSEEFQRDCARNLEFLFPDISRSITGLRSWRAQEDLFTEGCIRGAIELSPPFRHQPKVSAILKYSHANPGPQQWLQAGALQTAILSAILLVIHPNLYASGRETLLKLAGSTLDKEMKQIIPEWSTVYSVVSIIVNQATPFHRDLSCQVQWLDMLATIG